MNYYRRFPGDYLRDTAHLTMIEHGAYTLLLDYAYSSGKPLPADLPTLYKMTRADTEDERNSIDKILTFFFSKTRKGYTNKKIKKEQKKRHEWRKWQKTHRHKNPDTVPDKTSPVITHPFPSPFPSPINTKPTEREEHSRCWFDKFWKSYPNQIDRDDAWREFLAIDPLRQELCVESVPRWLQSPQWAERQFIPSPVTFLRKRRWEYAPKEKPKEVSLDERAKEIERKYGVS